MPKATSTKYRSLQVGSGKGKIKFKDGEAEVTAAQAKRLEKVPGVTVTGAQSADKPLDKRTGEELKAYAAEHDIDLGEARTKAEVFAAIQAAEESGDGDPGDPSDATS